MNIFDFAMEKERFSESYYRKLAADAGNKGLSNIFLMLAGEESKHFHLIEGMKAQANVDVAETSLLEDAGKIFSSMRDSAEHFNFNVTQLELYRKAKDIEQQSIKFYLEKSEQIPDPRQKHIFKILADEEKKHYRLLDDIMELVSRPQEWLENAEWYHLDTY
jgi:rubrerythrin